MTTGSDPQDLKAQDIEAVFPEADSRRSPWTRRYDDAPSVYDACLAKPSVANDVAARQAIARAKLGKGLYYFDLRMDDNGRLSLEAFAAESDGDDHFLTKLHAQSLLAIGQKLLDKDMLDEAIALFQRLGRSDQALHVWASAIDCFVDDDRCADTLSDVRLSYAGIPIEAGAAVEPRKPCDAVIAAARDASSDLHYAFDEGKYCKCKWMKRGQEARAELKVLWSSKPEPESKT